VPKKSEFSKNLKGNFVGRNEENEQVQNNKSDDLDKVNVNTAKTTKVLNSPKEKI